MNTYIELTNEERERRDRANNRRAWQRLTQLKDNQCFIRVSFNLFPSDVARIRRMVDAGFITDEFHPEVHFGSAVARELTHDELRCKSIASHPSPSTSTQVPS
jgi:hypothetical protein